MLYISGTIDYNDTKVHHTPVGNTIKLPSGLPELILTLYLGLDLFVLETDMMVQYNNKYIFLLMRCLDSYLPVQ